MLTQNHLDRLKDIFDGIHCIVNRSREGELADCANDIAHLRDQVCELEEAPSFPCDIPPRMTIELRERRDALLS